MAAPRVSPDPDVESHYLAQTALTVALAAALRRLWPMVDVRDLRGSLDPYRAAVAVLVQHYGSASASLARDHYATMRAKAGVTAPFRIPTVDPAPVAQVDASVGWATSDLWDSRLLKPTEGFDPAPILEATQTKVEGAATKLALDTGRLEIIDATRSDRDARGWARVTKPGSCYFCAMLATRGAVYKSRTTASFEPHDHCHCTVEPLFGSAYEAPAHVRQTKALYDRVTAGVSGPEKALTFRRAYEAQF